MLENAIDFILSPPRLPESFSERAAHAKAIGRKAASLICLPPTWTPPFFLLHCAAYKRWRALNGAPAYQFVRSLASQILRESTQRFEQWHHGIIIRSSSVMETINERGAFTSKELPADFSEDSIAKAIASIFDDFEGVAREDVLALIVQARVPSILTGHLSNEIRVSKTVNQWMWETQPARDRSGRFNSQRSDPPDTTRALALRIGNNDSLFALFRSIGRWCTRLNQGRAHIEWGAWDDRLWLFQIDFEDDQPDVGQNPEDFIRESQPYDVAVQLPSGSLLEKADLNVKTGWPKIDNVARLIVGRHDSYPALYFISGSKLEACRGAEADLNREIELISRGRVVCRTECVSPDLGRLNLPRTDSITSEGAVAFMFRTLRELTERGANVREVCFILHRFIPARASAWVLANPDNQIVLVDSLWGLPDGLQYLTHDTYEYDVRRQEISAEHLRHKPMFLQELESGDWRLVRVARAKTRNRSLSVSDVSEIAEHSYAVARRAQSPVLIMWFCGVVDAAQIGRNVPWFMMDSVKIPPSERRTVAPGYKRFIIQKMEDIKAAYKLADRKYVLVLAPDVELIRSDEFLTDVIRVAKQKGLPVELTGSVLGHAFYTLEREGVAVVAPAVISRYRSRQRQIFRKLVRDDIPARIEEHGERATSARISKSESRAALVVKLLEEADELLRAESPKEVAAELADLLEVVRSLSAATGIDWDEVQKAAEKKREARGSFDLNVVLLETSWPSWLERRVFKAVDVIPLKDLGAVIREGNTYTITFPAIFGGGNRNRITLSGGERISISIGGNGIKIEELGSDESSDAQLRFNFGEE